jgi:hypothetical protein
MSAGVPNNSARRTKTYAAAALDDVDGIKTDFTGALVDTTYVPADFNGAQIAAGGVLDLPRVVTISRSSVANAYSTGNIVVTGKYGGADVVDTIAQPNDDGNDTLRGTKAFDHITSILIPANALNTGHFTIGVSDICAPSGDRFSGVKVAANGQLNVQYGQSNTDSFASVANTFEPIAPNRILTSAALSVPTTVGLTLYLP